MPDTECCSSQECDSSSGTGPCFTPKPRSPTVNRPGSARRTWSGQFGMNLGDVVVENEAFAQEMKQMYENDLTYSTEIVLAARKPHQAVPLVPRPRRGRFTEGSAGCAMRGLLRVGNTVGAAISRRQEVGPA